MSQARQFLLLTVPLTAIVAGWYATSSLPAAKPPTPREVPWVRTSDGWEKAWWLRKPAPPPPLPVHPALVAAFMLFSSIGLLTVGDQRETSADEESTSCALRIAPEDRL